MKKLIPIMLGMMILIMTSQSVVSVLAQTNKGSFGTHTRTFSDLLSKVNANKGYYIANP